MVDYGMLWWHLLGFTLVVTIIMVVLKKLLPKIEGFTRFALLCFVVAGTWYAHANYLVQSGPFLRDKLLAPVLGKRPTAERLAYVTEAKAWKDPDIRRALKDAPVLDRSRKILEIARDGMSRLSEDKQEEFLRISLRLFEVGQDNECIGMVKGTLPLDGYYRLLNRLKDEEIQAYYDLSLAAVAAGAAPSGAAAPPAEAELTAMMVGLIRSMPPSEQTRFRTAALVMQVGGEKDSCWFGNTLFTAMLSLPPASRAGVIAASLQPSQKAASPAPLQARRS